MLNPQLLFKRAFQPDSPDDLYLITGSGQYTYGDLALACRRFNAWLVANHSSDNEILIALSDPWHQAVVIYTQLLSGKPVLIADAGTTPAGLKSLIEKTGVKVVVSDQTVPGVSAEVRVLTPGSAVKKTGSLLSKFIKTTAPDSAAEPSLVSILSSGDALNPAPVTVPSETLAYVLFTSGTTSEPKGVMISYGALIAHLETFRNVYGYKPGDRMLNILPGHHADGLIQGLFLNAWCGSAWVRPFG